MFPCSMYFEFLVHYHLFDQSQNLITSLSFLHVLQEFVMVVIRFSPVNLLPVYPSQDLLLVSFPYSIAMLEMIFFVGVTTLAQPMQ